MKILVLETSTTSAKGMLYDTENSTITLKTKPYPVLNDDISLLDPQMMAEEVFEVGRELCKGHTIDVISLSGTWHSLLLCDREMKPVSPIYLWSYTGAGKITDKLKEDDNYREKFYRKTGCVVHGMYPFFKLKKFISEELELSDKILMDQGSYMMYQLTHTYKTSRSMASGTGLLNIHTKEYDSELLKELNLRIDSLPGLIDSDNTFPLTEEGAKQLGIIKGVPVLVANPDGALNQVGSDAVKKGIMTLSVGTSGALRIMMDKPKFSKDQSTWSYVAPSGYIIGAATSGACNCIDWYKNQTFKESESYDEIEEKAFSEKEVPIFLPFVYGERAPGWETSRTYSFCDEDVDSSDYSKYRGVMEGILFNLYQCYEKLIDLNGKPSVIKLSGGILHSKRWVQMCADIFNEVITVDHLAQASLFGGVRLGLEVLGLEYIHNEKRETLIPNMDKHREYKKRYERYLYWYNQKSF